MRTAEVMSRFEAFMLEALEEAWKGLRKGEVPVGAVLVGADGEIIGRGHNQPVTLQDPTAHAEILALRAGCMRTGNYRLRDATLVSTVEPCVMCMGAALHARVSRLVFGAWDPRAGSAGSVFDLSSDKRLNHRIEVIGGVLEPRCRRLIQEFFRSRRGGGV